MKSGFVILFFLCLFTHSRGQNLYLLSPVDDATHVQPYPIFTWRLNGLSQPDISYTIKIAEYNSGIGEHASINTNPVYSKTIISSNPFQVFYYPTVAPVLSDCEEYVWQVIASYTTYTTQEPISPINTYTYSSPISRFMTSGCIPSEAPTPPEPTSKLYIEPKKQTDNFVHLVSDSLYIKYNESYNNTQAAYKIYNSDTVIVNSHIPVSYGLNYLAIDLEGLGLQPSSAPAPSIYMFELKTAKGDILRTKFEKQ